MQILLGQIGDTLIRPDPAFQELPLAFWANVRFVSQQVGYSQRGTKTVRVPDRSEVIQELVKAGLRSDHLFLPEGRDTAMGTKLLDYFRYRAEVLNTRVEPLLMNADRAQAVFDEHYRNLRPRAPIPMNKQKGEKKAPAFFTGLINMLVEAHLDGEPCDYDPRQLTTITNEGLPVQTLSRRVDGAFPTAMNPIALWEIKEYYYTTTFGSRVADGVYESLLDGMELSQLRDQAGIQVQHYLMVDSHFTWWECGRSYLCRMIDMLHMGYVDEVLFGYEVVEELPRIVSGWLELHR